MAAATRPGGATPIVHLISSDYIKDFLMKEDYFKRKLPVATFPLNAGMIFEHGPDAMQKRSLLQSVMKYDDLKTFTPLILKMIYEFFHEFIMAKGVNNSEYITIDLNDIYPVLIKRLTRMLLFGVYDLKNDSIEALIQTDSEKTVNMAFSVIKNPVFNIAPSLFYKFPFLLSSMVEYKKKEVEQRARIAEYLKAREGDDPKGNSVMEKILAHNKQCVKTGNMADYMDAESVFGSMNLISFASIDTTQQLTKSSICILAESPEVRKALQATADRIYDSEGMTTSEKVESDIILGQYFKETIRLCYPAPGLFARIATKDVTIKDVSIKKGHGINTQFSSLTMNEEIFNKPNDFQLDRFSSENEKTHPKYQMIPFGVGKRLCIGRHFGELTTKLFITTFCKMFDFKKPDDADYYEGVFFTKSTVKPFVDVKLIAK